MTNSETYSYQDFEDSINCVFLMISTILIFMMHLGFAFLEGGNIRMKNIQSIQFKKCLTVCYTTLTWWVCGFAFAFGDDISGFIGSSHFFATKMTQNLYVKWMFQWGFAGTATTIVSGCIAERMPIIGYTFYNLFQVAWIYPIVCHWVWGDGWLHKLNYKDFAGSSVVHIVGGLSGLLATKMIGPRYGRFADDKQQDFKPNNIAYGVLGALMLWFSFFAFNTGSAKTTITNPFIVPLVGINTSMSAALAGISCTIIYYIVNNRKYSQNNLCNGFLSGLVGITGSSGYVEPWAACVIGILSSCTYLLVAALLNHLQIDDPIDSAALHLGCGIIGILSVAFFDYDEGLFYGGSGKILGVQILGIIIISIWVTGNSFVALLILKYFEILRELKHVEDEGLDQCYFGGSPYNYDLLTLRMLARLQRLEYKQKLEQMKKKQEKSIELVVDDQIFSNKFEGDIYLQSMID